MKLIPTEPDVRTLVERIDRGDIDLQPDFQRQEIWPLRKKKRLIDTVLRGWSIPPVHLVEIADSRAEVLDGQQRLATLRDFLHDRFSIDGSVTPEDNDIRSLHGKRYSSLDPSVRRKIDQYPLRCFRLVDYNPEEPSELFYRLNQPTILTAGEQRNALYGPAREQLKWCVAFFESLGNNKDSIGFSNLRLAYDDIFARILFFIESGNFGVKSTESRISERFRKDIPFSDDVMERALLAVELFTKQREFSPPYRFNKASILSWLLFLSRFRNGHDIEQNFLSFFISTSHGHVTSDFLTEAAALFQDRASLRVTDVSSVAYRDFALNYIYEFGSSAELPFNVPREPLVAVRNALRSTNRTSFEEALEEQLDILAWSHTL